MSKINLLKEPDTAITGTTENVEVFVTENRTFVVKDKDGVIFKKENP